MYVRIIYLEKSCKSKHIFSYQQIFQPLIVKKSQKTDLLTVPR